MQRILAQLETACVQLSKGLNKRIDESQGREGCQWFRPRKEEEPCSIAKFGQLPSREGKRPETEVDQIWQWNKAPPLSVDETTGNLRAPASTKQGREGKRSHQYVC
jgi:hypothetical protein